MLFTLVPFRTTMQPKVKKLQKYLQNQQKSSEHVFLGFFKFCAFSWKLAQKPTKVWTLRYFQFFWHPWHPWGWLSSGDTWVLNISLQWHYLAEILSFIKMIFHVSFIILVLKIVSLSVAIATKLTISKINHLIRLRFEQSEHKKSQRL